MVNKGEGLCRWFQMCARVSEFMYLHDALMVRLISIRLN